MRRTRVTVQHEAGLHARPASQFAGLARKFQSTITVSGKGKTVNAKSMVLILTLNINKETEIEIQAEGEDEKEAVTALVNLVESNFS